jgi:hypothetical protein
MCHVSQIDVFDEGKYHILLTKIAFWIIAHSWFSLHFVFPPFRHVLYFRAYSSIRSVRINAANYVPVEHIQNEDCCYILGQFMSKRIMCCIKPGLHAKRDEVEGEEEREKIKCICIYRQNRQGLWPVTWRRKDAPWQRKPQLSWLQPKSGHESQRGSVPRQTDWETDRPSVAQ